MENYNIRYEIIGKTDGRWTVQAFDSRGNQLGSTVLVNTPDEAFKIYMLLNGYSFDEQKYKVSLEDTQEIDIEALNKQGVA